MTHSAAAEQLHRKKKISTMNKLIGPLCAVSAAVVLAVVPTYAPITFASHRALRVASDCSFLFAFRNKQGAGQRID